MRSPQNRRENAAPTVADGIMTGTANARKVEVIRVENEIEINGNAYVLKSSIKTTLPKAATWKGKQYAIVRTYSAGVFAGYVAKENGQEATVLNARRLWYWEGAASLSQMAMEGTSKPNKCKFPQEVSEVRLKNVIEIIPCTEKAKTSIGSVAVWQA